MAAAGVAVLAVLVLWMAPRAAPPTGTLVVIAAGRGATSIPSATLAVHRQGGDWLTAGTVSGGVPAAPDQRQVLVVPLPAGSYNAVRMGDQTQALSLSVTAGLVEPLLLGIDSGRLGTGWVYAGNDDVNLGLGELAGRFVPMPAFSLVDQGGRPISLGSIAGRDVIIAAFHTTCHQTCPLYTALFLQLAKRLPASAMLLEVTTDPGADSPAALSAYAKQTGAGWTFGTGTSDQLASFWKPFNVELSSGDEHTSTLVLVDRHGYVRLVYRGVPKVGGDIPPSLVTSLSAQGLAELGSGGDGWAAPDVLSALATIGGGESSSQPGGGAAGAFSLTATDGTQVSLGELSGKPVVINFWATYCPPCRAEMPMLAGSLGPQTAARLLLVNEGDSSVSAGAFLRGLGIRQPALLDTNLSVGRTYGVFELPVTIFVRADGTIDRKQVGQLDPNVLAAELSNLTSQ